MTTKIRRDQVESRERFCEARDEDRQLMNSSSKRDYRLDFFRGIALLGIALNHTVPGARFLEKHGHYQFGHLFAFNFADVFVFISGWVCGIVYGKVLQKHGFSSTQSKALRRAFTLFLANAAAAVACLAIVAAFGRFGVFGVVHGIHHESYWQALLGTVSAVDAIAYFNILSLYVVFLVALPLVLWLYQKVGFWVLVPLGAMYAFVNYLAIVGTLRVPGSFFGHPAAWQMLFFGAALLGRANDQGRLPQLRAMWVVPGFLLFLWLTDYLDQVNSIVHNFSHRAAAGPVRGAQLLVVSYLIGRFLPPDGRWMKYQWSAAVVRCGQNSLLVFCISLVTCYAASLLATALAVGRLGYLAILGGVLLVTLVSGNFRALAVTWKAGPRFAQG